MKEKLNFNQYIFEKILTNYDLGVIKSYLQLQGWFNTSFLIETENGRFVLKFFRPDSRVQEEIDFLFFLLSYLLNFGFPVYKTIPNKSGDLVFEVEILERIMKVVIFGFLPGEHKVYTEIKKIHLQEVGRVLGNLHETLKGFPKEKLLKVKSSQENFRQALKRTHRQLTRNFSENYFRLSEEKINFFEQTWKGDYKNLLALSSKLESKELQLIHGDFTTGNVVFINDEISGILDFDNVRMGLTLEDLAHTVGAWFLNAVEMDAGICIHEIVRSYKEGYSSEEQSFLTILIRLYIWEQIAWAIGPPEVDYLEKQHQSSLKTFERKYKEFSLLKYDDIFTN